MRTRDLLATSLAVAAAAAVLAGPGSASASPRPMWLGLEEPLALGARYPQPLETDPAAKVTLALSKRVKSAGVRFQRISISWRRIAPTKPTDATDPNDPAYDFRQLDETLRAAADSRPAIGVGLEPLLTVEEAPDWAEMAGNPRPKNCPASRTDPNREYCRYPGTWKPDPAAMRDFAQALAARYDGTRKNKNKRLLPRVTYFQAWNEPNLSTHLTPQHQGRKYVGASVYRNLLNAFRVGLSAAGRTEASCGGNPSSTDACLVAAGLAPFGNTVSVRDGTGPQDFARAVLCLRYQKVHGRRTLVRIPSCPASSFDAWAQHPYDLIGTPDGEPDYDGHNGLLADLPAIRKIVNTATKLGTAVPAGRKQLWVTEFDWWTNPPNRFYGRSLKTVARWTTDSLFRAWRAGVDVLFWYRSTDVPQWPGGLWLAGANLSPGQISLVSMQKDRAKPELANFRWPMRIAPGRRPYAWGIVRCRQPNVPVRIQKRFHRRWVNTSVATTAASGVFTTRLPAKGHGNGIWRGVAASACGGNSPVWSTKG